MQGSQFYRCAMKVQAVRDVVRYVGITRCNGVAMANIPLAEKKQAQLMTVRQDASGDEKELRNTVC